MRSKRTSTGVRLRHSRSCPTLSGGDCTAGRKDGCQPYYEACVYSPREHKKLRKSFPTEAAAKAWRADAMVALRKGELRSPSKVAIREAAEAWIAGAVAGTIRTKSGDPYKPSVIHSYCSALQNRVLPKFGDVKLSELRRVDVQDFADSLLAANLDPSTIRNTLMPLRVIFRRALSRGEVNVNPLSGLELPAVRGTRDRIASPEEASNLLEALSPADRALWATGIYAGLRRGELRALKWDDIDFAKSVIRVERSMDDQGHTTAPKSKAGTRTVPIPTVLRELLIEHRLRSGRAEGYVFGAARDRPFTASNVGRRARTAWDKANKTETEKAQRENRAPDLLEPIGLHECRHTYASLMIAAGVNAKALSTYMGHSSITITLDRYGHLMPGNEDEAAELLNTYLIREAKKSC